MTKKENYDLLVGDKSDIRNVIKLEDNVIVFPAWDKIGLLGKIFAQMVKTKEAIEGQVYAEDEFRPVFRILGGRLLIDGLPDSYTWRNEKYKEMQSSGKVTKIGTASAAGLVNLAAVISSIGDEAEKAMFAGMFAGLNVDLEYVHTPADPRRGIMVTEDMLKRCPFCINEWCNDTERCVLQVGDWLILNKKAETLYRVEKDTFAVTYSVLPR